MQGRNFDYPRPLRGRMAKNTLKRITSDAYQLDQVLRDDDTLPAWVDYYLATSQDRLSTASNYMRDEIAQFKPSGKNEGLGDVHRDFNFGDLGEMGDLTELGDLLETIFGGSTSGATDTKGKWLRYGLVALAVTSPLAGMAAFARHKSLPAAIGASIFSLPYLLYWGVTAGAKK